MYYGGSTGVISSSEQKVTRSGPPEDDGFGSAVSNAGDVNGDGYGDIVVGALQLNSLAGASFVRYGGASGIRTGIEVELRTQSGATGALFGSAAAGGGDFDADGYDDLIVGAFNNFVTQAAGGAVYAFHGRCAQCPHLRLVGGCPGLNRVFIAGLSTESLAVIVRGDEPGSGVIPAGLRCAGTTLNVDGNRKLLGVFDTTTSGTLTTLLPLSSGHCDQTRFQVLDLHTCRTSNVVIP